MRKTIERILGVTEKKMNKRFIARLSLFERIILSIFMYAWFAVEIAILAVVYCALWAWDGLKKLKVHIAAWFDRCVKKLAKNGYIFSLSEYNMTKLRRGVLVVIAFVLCLSFLIGGIAIRNNIEKENLEQGSLLSLISENIFEFLKDKEYINDLVKNNVLNADFLYYMAVY